MLEQVNKALQDRAQTQIAANDWRGACESWELIVRTNPKNPQAWANLGIARAQTGQYPEAVDAYANAMQHGLPEDEGACGIGLVFCLRQQYDIAAENLEMALARNPQNRQALSNLIVCYTRLGRIAHAFQASEALLQHDPDNLSALGSLGTLCKDAGMAEEAVAWNLRAAQAAPDSPEQVSNLLWSMLHSDARSTEDLLEIGKEFDRRALARAASDAPAAGFMTEDLRPTPSAPPGRANGGAKTLRVGLLSADLRQHAVGHFIIPILEALDPTRITSIAYNTGHFRDAMSTRAQAVTQWRDVAALSDQALISLIRKDRLDILIDLSGHTEGARLAALAQRAAPVQISWLGYPASTGLSTMDYVLVPPDPVLTSGDWCSEKPLALPDCYYVREPSHLHFATGDAPFMRNGYLTLGCLNNLAKLSPACIAAWSRILSSVPTARLVLVINSSADNALQDDLRKRFADHGIAPERLDLRGRMDYDTYRRTWHELDLALDPFPFNGGTTGLDALCAGIPFITLAGQGLHARLGINLLHAAGLDELAADSVDAYADKAIALATDTTTLQATRQQLRDTLPTSPLFDIPRFARGLEQLFAHISA